MKRARYNPRRHNRAAAESALAAIYERNREIVRGGTCPKCGTRLKRNNAIAGWWQCQASINEEYRDADLRGRELPRCSFQCFTQ